MYTNVQAYGNSLLVTEVKEGITSYHTIKDFHPNLFVQATSSELDSGYKGFPDNLPLEKLEFENLKEYRDYTFRNRDVDANFYGNIGAEYQYINKYYNKTDTEKTRVWFMDIETNVTKGAFPVPELEPITVLQIYDTIEDKIIVLSWLKDYSTTEDDVTFIFCVDEKDMLDKFLKMYYHYKPHAVAGINFVHFDTNYMITRLNILGYEKNILSPFGKSYTYKYTKFNERYEVELPIGVIWIDYMDIVDKHAFLKLSGKSLNVLASTVLGEDVKKLDFKRYFKSFYDMAHFIYTPPYDITEEEKQEPIYKAYLAKDTVLVEKLAFIKFTEYSILDVRLLKEIDLKLGMMNVVFGYAWGMGCNVYDSLATIVPWDAMLYGKLIDKKLVVSSFDDEEEKYSIAGGYWNSTTGLYKWIASFDFTSQYPIGCATLNICPTTHIRQKDIPEDLQELIAPLQKKVINGEIKDDEKNMFTYIDFSSEKKEKILELLIKYNVTLSPNGTIFTKKHKGEIPIIIEEIFSKRIEYKKIMKQAFKDGDLIKGELLSRGIKV